MKQKLPLYLAYFTLIAVMAVLNGILFYSSKCSVEYLQTRSVWGQSDSVRLSDDRRQKHLLTTLPEDPVKALHMVYSIRDYLLLSSYRQKEQEEDYPYTDYMNRNQITSEDLDNLSRIAGSIHNSLYYPEFIRSIGENAENIADILYPLGEDAWSLRNAAQCKKDYYGMEYLQLPILIDSGIQMLVQYHVTDFLAFLLLLFLTGLFILHVRGRLALDSSSLGGEVFVTLAAALTGVVLLYLSNLLILQHTVGIPDLTIPLQSLRAFIDCPYPLSLGGFLALVLGIKLAGLMVLLLLTLFCVAISFSPGPGGRWRRLALPCLMLFLGAEAYLAAYRGQEPLPVLFREINLFSGLTPERFFNRYLNLNLAGEAVSRLPLFLILLSAALLLSSALTWRQLSGLQTRARRSLQQAYFDEIEARYQETRRLWHDFNNHLLAVKALYSAGHREEAEKYIDELSAHSRENLLPAKTGSNVVDLLLFKKSQQAREQGCRLSLTVGCNLKDFSIADYDLCSLLGNLLDNALEALAGNDPGAVITLKLERQGELLFLSCQNPYIGHPRSQGGLFPTTKADKAHHGIGLSSVREICRKYKGTLDIRQEDNLFTVTLLLSDTH